MSSPKVYRVGVLGCTGMVGQRFIQLLDSHPYLHVHKVGASERSAGKSYAEACVHWQMDTAMPARVAALTVLPCRAELFADCDIVFSGLDSSVAGEIEGAFRAAELCVFSNAKNYRMDELVPLVVPLVNPDHLQAIARQRKALGLRRGFIVTNANCSTTGMAVVLKPLYEKYGLQQVNVVTMQAISGAGYPGISALDIVGNVVPYIGDEEEKLKEEPLKILGKCGEDGVFEDAAFVVDATCNRVPVIDGHTACLSLKFAQATPPSVDDIIDTLRTYTTLAQKQRIHSAPNDAIIVHYGTPGASARPQPRLDVNAGEGFSVSVGRVRKGNYWDVELTLLSHNTILGAAGSAILNAEMAIAGQWV